MSGVNFGFVSETVNPPGPSQPRPPRSVPPYVYPAHEVPDPEPPRAYESRWKPFVRQADRMMGPRDPGTHRVNLSELDRQNDLSGPLRNPCRRRPVPVPPVVAAKTKAHFLFFKSGWIPIILRIIQWVCSLASLVLSIYVIRHDDRSFRQSVSVYLALGVSALALPYLLVIGHDEYYSKPIGQRSPLAKMRQLLLDLIFIVLATVNVTMAFSVVVTSKPNGQPTFDHQQIGLAWLLLVVLLAWLLTFVLSVLRVIYVMDRRQKLTEANDDEE